jgi:probable rRNA maturation factor
MPDADSALTIELVEQAGDWGGIATGSIIDTVAASLRAHVPDACGTATVALADDALVHDLNARFRKVDRPTNVLSFPSGEVPETGAYLGDVILAAETLHREAVVDGKPADHHFAHLALHGILHLMGHDHETDEDAIRMEALETAILADLGIPDPYLSRIPEIAGT